MKKIAVITTTRAEFGLLKPVIEELKKQKNENTEIEIIVTGTHLSEKFGNTIEEIKKSNIVIDEIVQIPVGTRDANEISHNQAVALERFTNLFFQKKYDGIVVLGDRYEMLAVCIAAGNTNTPTFHLCGGDTTEGAIDEWIRHSITKMSYLHFPTNIDSYNRIVQLGENPDRVFNYGSTSLDNIEACANMCISEILMDIGVRGDRYAICTFHPVTMEENQALKQAEALLNAMKDLSEIEFILTKSNADLGGEELNHYYEREAERIKNLHVVSSLGTKKYLSLLKGAEFVIGNSSSGIIEAPCFGIPTINIGDRQRGRLQSKSVINCSPDTSCIISSVHAAESEEFREICKNVISPYGDGHASERIAKKILEVVNSGSIDLKKSFYNLEVL